MVCDAARRPLALCTRFHVLSDALADWASMRSLLVGSLSNELLAGLPSVASAQPSSTLWSPYKFTAGSPPCCRL